VCQGIVSAVTCKINAARNDDPTTFRTYRLKVISDGEACVVLHHHWAPCPHGRVASLVDDHPTRLTLVTLLTNAPEMEEIRFIVCKLSRIYQDVIFGNFCNGFRRIVFAMFANFSILQGLGQIGKSHFLKVAAQIR
jgi:hypothetical protein